jgi:hypothetical protein
MVFVNSYENGEKDDNTYPDPPKQEDVLCCLTVLHLANYAYIITSGSKETSFKDGPALSRKYFK